MTKKTTVVNFILDKSGSMSENMDATITGFNEYIQSLKSQQKKSKINFNFSLTLFDTVVTHPHINVPIEEVNELSRNNYIPDNLTALYDAACSTIKSLEGTLKEDQKSLVVIMTDGYENASKEYKRSDLQAMIKRLEDTGNWTFVFLGSNQDSFKEAGQMGFSDMNTSNYQASAAGTRAVFHAMSVNTAAFAEEERGNVTDFFSKEDQDKLENIK